MALGLILLAAAMMVSGAAAVMFGSEIIMVERGWAMVIAGATSFSAGAVLLGIAAVLRTLERLAHGIASGRDLAEARKPAPQPHSVAPAIAAPIVLPPPPPPVVAEPEPQPVAAARAPAPARTQPAPPIEISRPPADNEDWAPEMPELRAERAYEGHAYGAVPNGANAHDESDILVAPDPPRLRIVETRSAPPAPPPEPARAPEPPWQPEPEPIAVVGKYSSGGNSYVMFSDGSIHADTPTGQHRFASLDELKRFVAGGGERS